MTPWARRLLIANVALFLVTLAAAEVRELALLVDRLALVPALIPYRPWTIVTYAFLHADLLHLLFNMIGLYFFGPRLESVLGARRFLGLYFTSAIAAALASLMTPFAVIVGASGAIFGILMGYAKYWPHDRIYFWGVIPIQARWFIVLLAAYSIVGGLRSGGGIAHFAHLGGIVGGWIFLRTMEARSRAARFRKQAAPAAKRVTEAELERWRRIPRESLHPVNREELERILRKIDERGPDSLDPGERAYLERLSATD